MLSVGSETGLYVCSHPVDMRKAIDGLVILVIELLEKAPEADAAYVFYNKSRDKIKILCWHKNGFVLFYKRLERGKFKSLFCFHFFTSSYIDNKLEIL